MRTILPIRTAALAVLFAAFAGAALAQGVGAQGMDMQGEGVQMNAAQGEDGVSVVGGAAVAPMPEETPAAPVRPLYQLLTQDSHRYDLGGMSLQRNESTLEIPGGSNWGVSLGFERGGARNSPDNVDGLSAGAYFRVSPRVRVGGELGYRAGQSDAIGLRPKDETGSSQVKLESAFRF